MTTATRCRPIIFSGPMVEAILANRKTMTRRVVKPQPESVSGGMLWDWECPAYTIRHTTDDLLKSRMLPYCPYGAVGDKLWVRETHWLAPSEAFAEGLGTHVIYRADRIGKCGRDGQPIIKWTWRPSIHMPRWASRIMLEITGRRVERVQEISEADAVAEGFARREHFIRYWDSLNAKRGFGFDANPWVWPISFKRDEE